LVVLAALAAALVLCGGARAATSCETRLLSDWHDGRIDGVYPVACYRGALTNMPEDLRIYSTAESDITRALQARVRAAPVRAAPVRAAPVRAAVPAGGPDRRVSPWLVVAITASVLVAGSLVALVR